MLEILVAFGWLGLLVAVIGLTRRTGEFLSHPMLVAGLAFGGSYVLKPMLVRHDVRYAVFDQVAGATIRAHDAALVLGLVGFAAMSAGFVVGPAGLVRRPLALLRWEPDRLPSFARASMLWAVAAFLALAWIVWSSGVATSEIRPFSRELRRAILFSMSGRGGQTTLGLLLPFFLALWAWAHAHLLLARPLVVARCAGIVAFGIGAIGLVGSRLWVLSAALGSLFLYDTFRRRLGVGVVVASLGAAAAAGGLLGVALLDVLDPIRRLGAPPIVESAVFRLAGSFDPYEGLVGTLDRDPEPLWGLSIAEDLAYSFVPRRLAPWKPEVYGTTRLQEIAFPGMFADFGMTASFPIGLLGEGVANFGLAGVVILPFAFGTLLRGIRLAELPRSGAAPVIAAFLLGWIAGPLRGLSPVLVQGMILVAAAALVQATARAIDWMSGGARDVEGRLLRGVADEVRT